MGPEIENKIRNWVSKDALCEHVNQKRQRNCTAAAVGAAVYDIGFDTDCVLGCTEHLSEIKEEVEKADKVTEVEIFIPDL